MLKPNREIWYIFFFKVEIWQLENQKNTLDILEKKSIGQLYLEKKSLTQTNIALNM
jgi:hypothetical protein